MVGSILYAAWRMRKFGPYNRRFDRILQMGWSSSNTPSVCFLPWWDTLTRTRKACSQYFCKVAAIPSSHDKILRSYSFVVCVVHGTHSSNASNGVDKKESNQPASNDDDDHLPHKMRQDGIGGMRPQKVFVVSLGIGASRMAAKIVPNALGLLL